MKKTAVKYPMKIQKIKNFLEYIFVLDYTELGLVFVTDYITVSYDIVKIRLNCFTTMLQSAFHRLRPSLPAATHGTSRVRVYHFNVWHFHQLRFFFASAFRCDSLFLTLSIVASHTLGNVKCINISNQRKYRFETNDFILNRRTYLRKFTKFRLITSEYCLLKRFNVYKWLKISCLSMFLSYLLAEIILAFILLIANWFLWD